MTRRFVSTGFVFACLLHVDVAFTGRATLLTAGVITGLGVAGMHYIGMASMRMGGALEYEAFLVVLSVVIAIVAATTALRATVSVRGFKASIGASLIMGLAVTGMHYTGMASMSVHLHGTGGDSGTHVLSVMLPMLLGPLVFLLFATAVVMFDPLLIAGDELAVVRPARRGEPSVPDFPARRDTASHLAPAFAHEPAAPHDSAPGFQGPTTPHGDGMPAAGWGTGAGAGGQGERPTGW
ncbi:MHYT domain-containing protein [Streptomyces althioticus]|uniref:MHYT domain-containing protein n=1 Tax=Streptomyces althioticus TaxID=83380 RepID=UPI0036C7B0C7